METVRNHAHLLVFSFIWSFPPPIKVMKQDCKLSPFSSFPGNMCVIYSFLQWKCLTWWLSVVKACQFLNGMQIEGKWNSICAAPTCLKSLREIFYLPFTLQENSIKASQIWDIEACIYICTDKLIKFVTTTAISYAINWHK